MSNGLPSAPGTTSPGSHPARYRRAGSPRQVARSIRDDSGGLPAGGAHAAIPTAPRSGDVIVSPPFPVFPRALIPYSVREWVTG
ncbi:hypothetical protein GCM10017688_17910 [Streptomyces ramulosus]